MGKYVCVCVCVLRKFLQLSHEFSTLNSPHVGTLNISIGINSDSFFLEGTCLGTKSNDGAVVSGSSKWSGASLREAMNGAKSIKPLTS